jgi:hypothetical protein
VPRVTVDVAATRLISDHIAIFNGSSSSNQNNNNNNNNNVLDLRFSGW